MHFQEEDEGPYYIYAENMMRKRDEIKTWVKKRLK
jgi:hypothetical protein